MKKNFIIFFLIAVVAIAVIGCKKNATPDEPTGNMQSVVLKGVVHDTQGNSLSGVKVITGTQSAVTDHKGEFSFSQVEVISKRAVLKFEKSGYFTLTRSREKQGEMFIDAVLHPMGNSDISQRTTFEAGKEATLKVGGMKVALSASSIMRADGTAYSGNVTANMLYLDPTKENFAGMMPGGDLAGLRNNGSESMLVSYGMTKVELTDNSGNALQLKSNLPAEVTFPIPEGMENNPPETMPLWSFDEAKGIWIEEGIAIRQGNLYVGTVNHFSWVNLDDPKERVTLKGKVRCEEDNSPVPFEKVSGGQTATYTNSKGEYTMAVPANTPVTVSVEAAGGSDAQNVPGYQGDSTHEIPTLFVPCDGDTPGEPGTFDEVEKAAVKYLMGDYNSIIIVTFDNFGKKLRIDDFDANNVLSSIQLVDFVKREYSVYNAEENEWESAPFYDSYKALNLCRFNIEMGLLNVLTQQGTMTVAGKLCKKYVYPLYPDLMTMAVWNGLLLLFESEDELGFTALKVTLTVPSKAFSQSTIEVDWL